MLKVFLDANVLQISVTHRPGQEARSVSWGGRVHHWLAHVMAPWTPSTEWLGQQASALPGIAALARSGTIQLCMGHEIRHELWCLKHGRLAFSRFSVFDDVEIELVAPPFFLDRIFISYDDRNGDAGRRRDFALSRTDDARFNELKRAAGGNKDADAYHIRCAEHAVADYFLTTDKRLKNSITHQKRVKVEVEVVFPTQLAALLGVGR